MSRIKQSLKYLILITIIYVSSHAALFIMGFFLGSETPFYVVEGRSMEQTFYQGDLLIVKGVEDKRDIYIEDIIVFYKTSGRLIVHRVIDKIVVNTQIEFITKGDNPRTNPTPDNWIVREKDVVGVVIARVPAVGSIFMVIQSPVGTVLTVIVFIIVVGINIFYDEDKKEQEFLKKSIYKGERII